ncbi:DNA binding [Ascochyta rabiei]|uniref:DNA binding n=1 Tax=Didymella rabiei TaxID=5454 RepID=A0A163JKC2_DIDRA|nr:DNA binding [Ascochyta rabiei]
MEHGDGATTPSPSLHNERPSKRRRTLVHPPREVGLMRSVPGDRLSRFVGSASGIYFIRSVYGAIRGAHPSTTAPIETPESDHVPGEDDYLPSSNPNNSGRIWRDEETTARSLSSVSFQELVEWSGSYFANWHPFYPFLHAPSVLAYLERLPQSGGHTNDGASNFQMIILRSVMSISLADRRQSNVVNTAQYPADLVFQSYDDAMDCLQHVLSRPTTIQSLQAAISVQLFLVSMLRLNAASRLGGLVIRMALQLGLHRCPARFPSFSIAEKEHRQRIFWSLYAMDRFICQSMGLPLSLHDDDVDVCYPTAERHPNNDRLRLTSLLARQYTIRGQIIELRNKSLHYVQKDPDQATAITAKLAQWWNDVEDFHDTEDDQNASAYHRTVLTMLKHESIISLNRPTLAASRQGHAYDAALQQCIGSARAIITTLHKAIRPRNELELGSESVALLWPSCTWAAWISTFILFHAASSNHVSDGIASRLTDKTIDVLHHLSRRGSVWPEASATAVRELRDRITQRPSRYHATAQSTPISRESNMRTNQEAGTQGLPQYTSSSGVNPSSNVPLTVPDHATSSTGLSQDGSSSYVAQPEAGPSAKPNNSMAHTSGASQNANTFPSFDNASSISYQNINTPVFDFGNSEWSDCVQANENLESNTMLPQTDSVDPYIGFDIPFWLGQDQYWDMLHDRN